MYQCDTSNEISNFLILNEISNFLVLNEISYETYPLGAVYFLETRPPVILDGYIAIWTGLDGTGNL